MVKKKLPYIVLSIALLGFNAYTRPALADNSGNPPITSNTITGSDPAPIHPTSADSLSLILLLLQTIGIA